MAVVRDDLMEAVAQMARETLLRRETLQVKRTAPANPTAPLTL
jgi:hypothetical protein